MSGKEIAKVISILKETYPKAACALHHENPLELLVATILSAQCTDERVNLVTPVLFRKYKTAKDFASADQNKFEDEIRSTGFFKNKTRNIIACAKTLCEKFEGKIPREMASLLTLPGVGRKTANVVLGSAFGISEGIVVDTHVKRLSQRLGFSGNDDPEKIETDLMKLVPKSDWILFSHLLILHGRNRCLARKPDCPNCELIVHCPRKI